MRPLTSLAPLDGPIAGVFTDIDDTLTDEGTLVPTAYAALERLKQAGLRVIPVTGRPAGWAAVLAATWPVDAVIAENGAVLFEPVRSPGGRQTVRPHFWDDEARRTQSAARLALVRETLLGSFRCARLANDQWLRLCDVAFDIGEEQRLGPEERSQLVQAIEALGARALVSSVHVHAHFGDWDKAAMLRRAAALLWGEDLSDTVTRARYVFVGDSENDQAGFRDFPLSVGVANVRAVADRLVPPPAFVTPSRGGHGFTELAAHLLELGASTR
jgi:HAD superfamily hydrolase (TIGR01484 family)